MQLLLIGSMNLDTFFTYLDKPETLNRQTLDELSEFEDDVTLVSFKPHDCFI